MTAQQDPYVRVYYRIIDDPKFRDVFDDDARLACWLRLLLIADGTYPAPAPVPAGVKRSAFQHLVTAGLVDLEPGNRFRIHGMEGERGGRSQRAANAAAERWAQRNRDARPDAAAMRTHSVSTASASDVGMHSAPLRSEPIRSAPLQADAPRPDDATASPTDDDQLDVWYRLTGSWPSQKVIPWINELAGGHGCDRFAAALAEEFRIDPDRRDLLSRTQTRLEAASHAASKARRRADEEREAEERRRIDEMPAELRAENLARLKAEMVERGLLPAGADR